MFVIKFFLSVRIRESMNPPERKLISTHHFTIIQQTLNTPRADSQFLDGRTAFDSSKLECNINIFIKSTPIILHSRWDYTVYNHNSDDLGSISSLHPSNRQLFTCFTIANKPLRTQDVNKRVIIGAKLHRKSLMKTICILNAP
jgi:hypothetical protein